MARYDYPNATEATIRPMSEHQLAERVERAGVHVRYARGRHWRSLKRGFYAPLHWLALLSSDEAHLPGPGWGFVAALDENSRDLANASIPMHLLSDIASFDESNVPRNTRSARRRLRKLGIRIVSVTDEQVFYDQGYDVACEWRERNGYAVPSRERFLGDMTERIHDPAWLVLAGMDEDKLLGFSFAWVVDDVAYLKGYSFVTAAMKLRLSAAMNYEVAAVLRDSGMVRQASPGIAMPEFEGMTNYKTEQGYPIVNVPARLAIPRPVAWFMASRRPLAWYRLSGTMPSLPSRPDRPKTIGSAKRPVG